MTIGARPLVAILRGVRPDEVEQIGEAVFEAGISWIEVPLNSPDPLTSIAKLVTKLGERAVVGAGTVLSVDQVDEVAATGARLIVSPNMNPDVIRMTKAKGMISLPGVFTATECFAALDAGADGLKFFPGDVIGPSGLKALKAVLPPTVTTYAVGGVDAGNAAAWLAAGADGFGLGGALYKPGDSAQQVGEKTRAMVEAFDNGAA
ncbi:MAG: 2-dehydro-3-deoxy-6-phosphogalactonate aldolase [Hyphomicrobiales bacterium]